MRFVSRWGTGDIPAGWISPGALNPVVGKQEHP